MHKEDIGLWFALLSMLIGLVIGIGFWLRLRGKKGLRDSVAGARSWKGELGWTGDVH